MPPQAQGQYMSGTPNFPAPNLPILSQNVQAGHYAQVRSTLGDFHILHRENYGHDEPGSLDMVTHPYVQPDPNPFVEMGDATTRSHAVAPSAFYSTEFLDSVFWHQHCHASSYPTEDRVVRARLTFSFSDDPIGNRNWSHTHECVLFTPGLPLRLFGEDSREHGLQPCLAQFDTIVLTGVLGQSPLNDEGSLCSPEEKLIWSSVQQLFGHLWLVHNFCLVWIESPQPYDYYIYTSVVAYLIHSLGNQLQSHFWQIISRAQFFENPEACNLRPAVVLYVLESLEKMLRVMQHTNWDVDARRPHASLAMLQNHLNARVGSHLKDVSTLRQHLSMKYKTDKRSRKLSPAPKFLHCIREWKSTTFPRQCNIMISLRDDGLGEQNSKPQNSSYRYRAIDF